MSEEKIKCPGCHTLYEVEPPYCRNCGWRFQPLAMRLAELILGSVTCSGTIESNSDV